VKMKVVINDCFGGFSLSHEAVMRYAELKGIKLYPWLDDITKSVYGDRAKIGESFLTHYTTVPEDEFKQIEDKEREKPVRPGRFAKSNALYFNDRHIERTDPLLIQVIKELGKRANGVAAKLKIVNVPDNVKWTIEEYDGSEWVAEEHRTWG